MDEGELKYHDDSTDATAKIPTILLTLGTLWGGVLSGHVIVAALTVLGRGYALYRELQRDNFYHWGPLELDSVKGKTKYL